MQVVGAMQRPHAPPVPPRPSRQVVAEALKRSVRLPCPTRQAPPPPNVRPWRPDAHPAVKTRTVVYESNKAGENYQRPVSSQRRSPTGRKDVVTAEVAKAHECKKPADKVRSEIDEVTGRVVQGLDDSRPTGKTTVMVTKSDETLDCASVLVVEKLARSATAATEDNNENIQHQDWLEAGIRYSSTKITLPGDDLICEVATKPSGPIHVDKAHEFSSLHEKIAMSSLQGLPPLPRSLSGFNLNESRREAVEPPPPPARSSSKTPKSGKAVVTARPSPSGRQLTTLDTQLAVLRKEMFGLRQLDLSLLSQLWSLNESIQEFRALLQDQEDRAPSPSPSSEEGDDVAYANHPPAPPRRPGVHHHSHHHHHHHHRPPRPARPLRPLPSDESPSSEEYGAV